MSCWVTVEGKKNVELSRLRLRQPECGGQARDPPCLDTLRRISRAMAIVRHRHAIRSRDRGPPVDISEMLDITESSGNPD